MGKSGRIFAVGTDDDSTPYLFDVIPTNASKEECVPLAHSYVLALSAGPALVMVENLVFFFSVLLYRRKLKHNNVYTYVTSALLANILTSSWAFYHFLNYYFGFESTTPSSWWAFRKGLTAGFSLILCGNIGLLIYAIEDSTYVVGRLAPSSKKSNKMDPKLRMQKAFCLITIAWVIPVLYGLLAMSDWSCTSGCTCTLHYESQEPICPMRHCSRLYTPMSKSYLLVIACMWAVECVVLLVLLCRSASVAVRESTPRATPENSLLKTTSNPAKVLFSRIPASHTFLLILLGLFVICTCPVMTLIVVDWAIKENFVSSVVTNLMVPLPLVYCFISPILLTKRLSGMKSALLMALTLNWLKSKKQAKETIKKRTQSCAFNSREDIDQIDAV